MGKKIPGNTMVIRPFFYLRMPEVALGGAWQQPSDRYTWGGYIFPESAIQLKCVKNGAKIEIQETLEPESIMTFTFNHGACVVIFGNSLIFFDSEVKKQENKCLEDT